MLSFVRCNAPSPPPSLPLPVDGSHAHTDTHTHTVSLRSFVPSFIRSFVRSFIRSFVRSSFVRAFVRRLFIRSFIRLFIRHKQQSRRRRRRRRRRRCRCRYCVGLSLLCDSDLLVGGSKILPPSCWCTPSLVVCWARVCCRWCAVECGSRCVLGGDEEQAHDRSFVDTSESI